MAVDIRGTTGAEATADGSGNAALDITSIGVQADDYVILAIQQSSTSNIGAPSASLNSTGSMGAAKVDLWANDSLDSNLWYFAIKATAADTSISVSGMSASGKFAWGVRAYSGVDTTTQQDVAHQTATGTNTDRGNPPAITPTTAGAKIVALIGSSQTTTTALTGPSNMSNNQQYAYTQASVAGRVTLADHDWTSGSFDPAAQTGGTNSTSNAWCAVTLALRPLDLTQALTPSLFTNSQSFYSPTVAPGAVDLTPSLLTNSQTFYGPTVTQPASDQDLSPSLLNEGQTFYGPTVTPGAVDLAPSLVSNSQTFYAATVLSVSPLTPSLLTNGQTFYAATITTGSVDISPSRLDVSQTFYAATVAPGPVDLAPSLLSNTQTFYGPSVANTTPLEAPLLTNTQTFYAPTVTPGTVDISPPLLSSAPIFYGPTVAIDQVLYPPLIYSSGAPGSSGAKVTVTTL